MPLVFDISGEADGTFTLEDNGVRGDGMSVLRRPDGTVHALIAHPADALTILSRPGQNIVLNAADSFGTATFTVGNFTDSTQSPDSIAVRQLRSDNFITLVANETITEAGGDAAADIVAAGLTMSAGSGIGTAGNALETEFAFIEAETNTGGIHIANFGNVQIGGLSGFVRGLDVVTSGNIVFSTVGFIVLNDNTGASSVHGGDISGNVTLTAIGAESDIFTTIDVPMISAAGGGITLNAGRDILVGTGGLNFNNDILATTFVTINAGQDFVLDGTSNVRTSAFGGVVGGPIDIQAGRHITLSNTSGGLQTIQSLGGDITLTAGPRGVFFENAALPGAIQSSDDIILKADIVQILSGGLNTTGIGSVTIRAATPGRAIDVGNGGDPFGAVGLSDAELDLLFTTNLIIGAENSGPVEFTAPVSPTVVPMTLVVRSGTDIIVNSSITMDNSLTMHAGDNLHFTAAGSFTTSFGGFSGFVDQAQNDGGRGGIASLDGTISADAITVSGNADNDTITGDAAANILNGGGGADTLNGGGGGDTLNGGTGADTMSGGNGNDLFIVDNVADAVVESSGASSGIDTVESSVNFTLGVNVERLTLTGTNSVNGTGNGLANVITGNSAANLLTGNGGADTLNGGAAGDSLDGGTGIDTMRGGLGGDAYFVDNVADTAIETSTSGGIDTVFSSVSFTLGTNVENLALTGGGAINGTGNSLANVISGNGAANVLSGAGGADAMNGRGGADTLNGGTGPDGLHGDSGNDTINGGDGADQIFGGTGHDDLAGGIGPDGFRFDAPLSATTNVDDILDYSAVDDTIFLEQDIFTTIAAGTLAAGAFRLGTAALDADDRIIYETATGRIWYDADGTGGAAKVLFARVDPGTALIAAEFVAYDDADAIAPAFQQKAGFATLAASALAPGDKDLLGLHADLSTLLMPRAEAELIAIF